MNQSVDQSPHRPKPAAYAGLFVGVLAISMGAILVRYAQGEATSLTIAAYRLLFASIAVSLPTLLFQRRELLSLPRRNVGAAVISGFFLAVHFAAWISSLEYTSVALSVVLVNTAPIWVLVFSPFLTRDRLSRKAVMAVALTFVGAAIIAFGTEATSQIARNDRLGALLAVIGAMGLAVYLSIGRSFRQEHSLGVYVTVCYSAAAVYLAVAAIASEQRLVGFSTQTWFALIGLAVVSQVIGHTTTNWALRYLSASALAVVLLGEPIGSSALAYLLFHETIGVTQFVGAAIILIGIVLATRAERPTSVE